MWPLSSIRGRLVLSGLLVTAELVALSIAVDTESLRHATGLAGLAGHWGPWALHCALLAGALTVVFALSRSGHLLQRKAGPLQPFHLAGHLAIFALFASSSFLLVSQPAGRAVLAILTALFGLATLVSGALALVPASFWLHLLQAAPHAPLLGVLASAGALAAFQASSRLADSWLRLTYEMAYLGLRATAGDVVADRTASILGTSRFQVEIAPACSGFEGLSLMLAFGVAWLWFFRRELRFPHALLLIPAGMAVISVMNWARIVVLILIGSAGAPEIAAGGFHSQAGWIAFLITAILFAMACQRVTWITLQPASPTPVSVPLASAGREADDTTAYLAPFLSILALGMLAQAVSAGFEWFYPLRVLGAAALLWWFRRSYRTLDWHIGWESPLLGGLVFALWLGADRLVGPQAVPTGMPAALAAAPELQRTLWLAFRVIGGVLTVPIAEELAFRGFLLRRLIDADFTHVSCRRFTWLSLLLSSVLFGILHGRLWQAGIVAGLFYAIAFLRKGRMGDAIVAHAVTNALLAIYVVVTDDWRLW